MKIWYGFSFRILDTSHYYNIYFKTSCYGSFNHFLSFIALHTTFTTTVATLHACFSHIIYTCLQIVTYMYILIPSLRCTETFRGNSTYDVRRTTHPQLKKLSVRSSLLHHFLYASSHPLSFINRVSNVLQTISAPLSTHFCNVAANRYHLFFASFCSVIPL